MKLYVPLLDNGNGSVMSAFMQDFFAAFRIHDIMNPRHGDSHPNRGMNKIANDFLKSDCDLWFNIDADIRHRPLDVYYLLEDVEKRGLDLVYGIYPKKDEKTEACLGTFDDIHADFETPLVEVRRSGRGFMLVHRKVLEAMKEDNGGPALRYHNHGEVQWDFFPSGVVTGVMSFYGTTSSNPKPEDINHPLDEDGYPKREWISEDWYFCERARALGFKTFVDTRVALGHVGSKEYRFNEGSQFTRMDSNIKTWQEIHGWFDYENFYRYLAEELPDGARFVEVGCWMGRSIGAMCEFIEKAGKSFDVHVVDKFTGDDDSTNALYQAILSAHNGSIESHFHDNMKALGLSDKITVHVKDSWDAAADFEDASLDAVFIDANHSVEAVRKDIAAWLPKIKPGGMLCGHDIDESGVAAAVWGAFGKDIEVEKRCWIKRIPVADNGAPAAVYVHEVDHAGAKPTLTEVHSSTAYSAGV